MNDAQVCRDFFPEGECRYQRACNVSQATSWVRINDHDNLSTRTSAHTGLLSHVPEAA